MDFLSRWFGRAGDPVASDDRLPINASGFDSFASSDVHDIKPWNLSNLASGVLQQTVAIQNEDEDDFIPPPDAEHTVGFGVKSIGFYGGMALLINNITGPGLVDLPVVYQQAGWVVPTLFMVCVMFMGTFSATMLSKAMATIPGNEKFDGRLELSTLAKIYFPWWGYWATILLLIGSLYATIISSIIVSAQTMDDALVDAVGYTGGLEVYPNPGWGHATHIGNGATPFGSGVYILSLGYVIVLVLSIPAGMFNLDDNIIIQIGAFLALMLVCVVWIVGFFFNGLDVNRVPHFGSSALDYSNVIGTIFFNYGFVTSVPSWVNEKKVKVSVNKSLWGASIYSTALFIVLGVMGGMAYEYKGNDDLLNGIQDAHTYKAVEILGKITVYLFPIVALLTSIPVFSIIIRYNLLEAGWCRRKWVANIWAVLMPWIVTIPFYTGSGLSDVITWFGLIVFGIINFTIPLWIYMQAVRKTPSNIEIHKILTTVHSGTPWGRRKDRGRSIEWEYRHPGYCHPGVGEPEGDFHAIPRFAQGICKPRVVAFTFCFFLTFIIVFNLVFDIVEIGLGNLSWQSA